MKLFKRGRFHSRRGAIRSDQDPVEDLSIGSNLSEADRFDIIVPLRTRRVLPLFGRDEGSVISSITSDEQHYQASSRRRNEGDTSKSPGGTILTSCCYGPDATKTNDYSVAANGGATQATQTTAQSTSSLFDWVCCTGPVSPIKEKVMPVKRTRGRDSVTSLVPTNSLFDSISSDEELDYAEEIIVSHRKRRTPWKLPKLRALPWRRHLNRGIDADSRQATASSA
jgi:hypothetical protein